MKVDLMFPQRVLLFLFVLLAVLIGGGLAYAYLPQAIIEVTPALREREVATEIFLSTTVEGPDFVAFKLPARVVDRSVEEIQFFEREAGEITEDFAQGQVRLINKQIDEQRLLPKTHLRHEETGVFFLTNAAAVIPPQSEIVVGVTAKEKGAAGNAFAGRFIVDKLPVSVQKRVYAESDQVFTGGVVVEKALTENELAAAREQVLSVTRGRVLGELSTEAGGAPLREDLTAFDEPVITTSVEPGSRANGYGLQAKIRARAFIVDDNDLLSLTLLRLRSAAEANEEFVTYDPQSFKAIIRRADFERGEAVVEGSLVGSFANKLGPTVFAGENLAGLSSDEVREQLQSLPGVGDVKVTLSPFWVTTVPSRIGSVDIQVGNN